MSRHSRPSTHPPVDEEPTPQELRVLTLLAAGRTTAEAADRLGVSFGSVNHSLDSLRRKTGTHRLPHLVAVAAARGWLCGALPTSSEPESTNPCQPASNPPPPSDPNAGEPELGPRQSNREPPTSDLQITVVILARNEARRIEAAVACTRGWAASVIVIDNESDDDTAAIARHMGALVLSAPRALRFDALRELAVPHVQTGWIYFLDADERVSPSLGRRLAEWVRVQPAEVAAAILPFRNHFCGRWIRNGLWWPGYSRRQLVRRDSFAYHPQLHGGLEVDGETVCFSHHDPECWVDHDSYVDLHHYLEKLDRYTSGEAEELGEQWASHGWQAMLGSFARDWEVYASRHAREDGMHGFLLAFNSGFYRFLARAKLWEERYRTREVGEQEPVPRSVAECLAVMERSDAATLDPLLATRVYAAPPPSSPHEPAASAQATPSGFPPDPGAARISALVMARNEARRLPPCLACLKGWVTQVIVLDHGSTDGTAEVARSNGAEVVPVPYDADRGACETDRGRSFDALRNEGLRHVRGDWVLIVDVDEHISPALAREYVRLASQPDQAYSGFVPTFRNWFCGRWMRHCGWYPGRLHFQLVRAGCLEFRDRVHGGISVSGKHADLPSDCVVDHFTYESLVDYMGKFNRYTDAEAEALDAEGARCTWQAMLAHFADEWRKYYDEGQGWRDGMHGFVLSFLSAFYRFTARAKLWDLRRRRGLPLPSDDVPSSVPAMLAFMRRCIEEPAFAAACMAGGSEPAGSVAAVAPEPGPAAAPVRPAAGSDDASAIFQAPLRDPSGYADDARQLWLAALEAGLDWRVSCEAWGGDARLPPALSRQLDALSVPADASCRLLIRQSLPGLLARSPSAAFQVVRTMFETDRLPPACVDRLNVMDRLWVPSEFNRETFIRSGADPDRLAVVPSVLDPAPFAAESCPWPLPGNPAGDGHSGPFRFLSVFDWTLHKGWDVLIEAFAREFPGPRPDAVLYLKTWSTHGYSLEQVRSQADGLLRARTGAGLDACPALRIWEDSIPAACLPRLYRAVDAFVIATRGEGWCRPLMQAMAAGLPTIATAWSGLTAFHDASVGYTLRHSLRPVPEEAAREIPLYRGHCWAEPEVEDLRRLLRRVVSEPKEARRLGNAAQLRILRSFSRAAVAPVLRAEVGRCLERAAERRSCRTPPPPRLPQAPAPAPAVPSRTPPFRTPPARPLPRHAPEPVDFRERLGRPLRVHFEGDLTLLSSLALCNREWLAALLHADAEGGQSDAASDVELSWREQLSPWHNVRLEGRLAPLAACRDAPLSGPPDVTLRHFFPPRWDRPEHGRLAVIQPWEYGHLPADWLAGALEADAVFAYSRWVRDVYLRSTSPAAPHGVPAERLYIVPPGFDPAVFSPEGPTLSLPTDKGVRFLFVGGAIDRKGADLLLECYLRSFGPDDDVCLVVKDMGTRSFYRGGTLGRRILAAGADPSAPQIVYLDDDLAPEELAGLYRACTCLAAPYRGEGFCLPALEAMACGIPAILTSGGPTDDFAVDESAWRLPHRIRRAPGNGVGPGDAFVCVDNPWQLEPDPARLGEILREVAGNPTAAAERGRLAARQVRDKWTWTQSGRDLRAALAGVVCPEPPAPFTPAVPWSPGGEEEA